MRLINTQTYSLQEFVSQEGRPKYTILSHRWEADEVTFQEMRDEGIECVKKGMRKVKACCDLSRKQGYLWTWVDTVCIDKRSSAELTEAINSMFAWYRESAICYAFLSDVRSWDSSASTWFTRGFTLQELLAPQELVFFNAQWVEIGTRAKPPRNTNISKITGIDENVLSGKKTLPECSIAERMSWASDRQTTRPEDRAYSLLGIFNVNMPLLYGEGAHAFQRLQEAIIQSSDDHSIFAWSFPEMKTHRGVLAYSPDAFPARDHRIATVHVRQGQTSYHLTNRGLSITLFITPWSTDTYLAFLNCRSTHVKAPQGRIAIFLRRLYADDQYCRVKIDGEMQITDGSERLQQRQREVDAVSSMTNSNGRSRVVNIRQTSLLGKELAFVSKRVYGFRLSTYLVARDANNKTKDSLKWHLKSKFIKWDASTRMVVAESGIGAYDDFGVLELKGRKLTAKLLRFGFDFDFNPYVMVSEDDREHNPQASERSGMRDPKFNLPHSAGSEDNLASKTKFIQHPGTKVIYPVCKWGVWHAKGDRIDGLDAVLVGSSLAGGKHIRVKIERNESPSGLVWDVELYNESPLPEY